MGRVKGSKNKAKIEATGALLGGSASTPYSFGGITKTAAGNIDVQQASSFFYSPELTTESWLLPKSRQEILKWFKPSGSLVYCRDGLKAIEDVTVGDEVLSQTGKWQKVLKTCKKFYTSKDQEGNECTKLKVQGLPEFKIGAYHPIAAIKKPQFDQGANWRGSGASDYIRRRKEIKRVVESDTLTIPKININKFLQTAFTEQELGLSNSLIQWLSPKKLEIGDYVVYPKFKEIQPQVEVNIDGQTLPINPEACYFYGWYVAEGHAYCSKYGGSINLSGNKDETLTFKTLQKIIMKSFKCNQVSLRPVEHCANAIYISFWNKHLAPVFQKAFGHRAKNKKIPDFILNSSKENLKAFLQGYFEGDGSFGKNKFTCATASQTLAYQLFLALTKLDILSSITKFSTKGKTYKCNGKKIKPAPYHYFLAVTGEMCGRLFEQYKNLKGKHVVKYLEDKKNFYLPVKEVKNYKKDQWGYDLKTEDHTYVSPVLVHNCRIFFNLEPYVQSITIMHALYPFSKFELNTSDKSVTQFYNDMAFNEDFDLYRFILQASLSYQKFGEAIMFGNMDKDERGFWQWSKFVLLEPELVEIKADVFEQNPSFELIPTVDMKNLIKSNRPEDIQRMEDLAQKAPEVVDAVKQGRNIRLDNEHVTQIARITDPSATRGTSPIQCLFKVLIYQDWIRLAQSAFAQRYIFPVELWTIGDLATNRIPDEATLQRFRNLINQAIQNPPFSMVFPPIVKYEALSTLGKFFPINNEYEYIHDQLMVGMGVNKNLILGEGPSFSNVKTMSLHRLMMVYQAIRDEFENWIKYKFFAPIARKNNFYKVVGKRKELILPTISWYKSLDIEQEEAERENYHKMHAEGYLSTKTLYSKYPALEYKVEQKQLEEERGTIWDKGDNRIPGKVTKTITPPKKKPDLGAPSTAPIKPIKPTPPEGGEIEEGPAPVEELPESLPTEPGVPPEETPLT